jgi:hypothetical protein
LPEKEARPFEIASIGVLVTETLMLALPEMIMDEARIGIKS